MEKNGIPLSDVKRRLEAEKVRDVTFSSGRIMGSMCTEPHPISVEAHNMFRESNLGNPGLYPGTAYLEEEVIRILGNLLGMSDPRGHVLSGGTEANITALYMAKKITGKKKVIFPKSAHFSVLKAVNLLDLEPVVIGLDERYRMSIDELRGSIDDDVTMVFAVAGSTELGMVDPIERISDVAVDIPLHVDAAFGGFVLPFLGEMGMLPEWVGRWDFSVRSVTSMTIDPHKMGLSTIPAGCLLYRDPFSLQKLSVDSPYLTSKNAYTLAGTRDSGSVAGSYAVMKHLGIEGYNQVVMKCMENTHYLKTRLIELDLTPVIEPLMNIVVVHHDDPFKVESELKKIGWNISLMRDPPALRFVVMPHVTRETIDEFIPCLERVLKGI
ncbi:MAG: tyrosine decarboxylase MfnA [Thermoplasmatota archaeon]